MEEQQAVFEPAQPSFLLVGGVRERKTEPKLYNGRATQLLREAVFIGSNSRIGTIWFLQVVLHQYGFLS